MTIMGSALWLLHAQVSLISFLVSVDEHFTRSFYSLHAKLLAFQAKNQLVVPRMHVCVI